MRTLRTIVATAVVTLAASAVAYAGVNGVADKNSAATEPAKAIAAHKQVRTGPGSGPATMSREQRNVRYRSEVRHEYAARHTDADPDGAPVHTRAREADQVRSGDHTRDQTRQQTRDQTCDQTCDQTRDQTCDQTRQQTGDQTCAQTRERSRDGSGECGGCGD